MLEKLKNIICSYVDIDPEKITAESKFLKDLGMSSLDLVMAAGDIQSEFGVEIPDNIYVSLRTVGGLMEYIESRC